MGAEQVQQVPKRSPNGPSSTAQNEQQRICLMTFDFGGRVWKGGNVNCFNSFMIV